MLNLQDNRRSYLGTDPRDGKEVVFVPLGRTADKVARLLPENFKRIVDGGVSHHWSLATNGSGGAYVRASLQGGRRGLQITIARIVANAKERQRVRHRDRDPTNLRRDNLFIERGYTRRHDRELGTAQPSLNAEM